MKSLTVAEIASMLNCPAPAGAAGLVITGMQNLTDAGEHDLAFLSAESYLPQFRASKAGVIVVKRRIILPADHNRVVLPVDDVDMAVVKVLQRLAPQREKLPAGVDPSARVDRSAQLGDGVAVGPHVIVGQRARIGARSILHPGVVIEEDVVVGDDCELFANVVIRQRVAIGHRVNINASSVLGTDGFGFVWDGKQHVKVPQIGTVVVEDDVEIGSCVCIDRAKFGCTRIGHGSKIDNLVQIAHNCQIGPHCIIVGQVGLAGSVTLGQGVIVGGQAGVRDHMMLGDGCMVAACSAVAEDIAPKTIVSGIPALPHRQSLREQAALRRLPDLVVQVRKIEEKLREMRKTEGA